MYGPPYPPYPPPPPPPSALGIVQGLLGLSTAVLQGGVMTVQALTNRVVWGIAPPPPPPWHGYHHHHFVECRPSYHHGCGCPCCGH